MRIKQPHPDSVAGDKKHTLKVLALETKTGKVVWEQTAYEGPVFDARHRRSTFAGPTAITDGKMVYAYFGPEGLYAYDFSGKLAWKVVEKFHTLGLGTGTSPVLYREPRSSSSATRTRRRRSSSPTTRRPARKCGRRQRPVQISWSTPVLVNVGQPHRAVTNGSEHVIAYDAVDRQGALEDQGRRQQRHPHAARRQGPGDRHRRLSRPSGSSRSGRATQPDDKRIAWEYTKGTGYVLSNILYGDYVYLSTDNGIITCLDAATGKVIYEGGRPPKPTHFMGSAVAYSGMIAMTSEDGDTFMLKAGPKHEIVRTNTRRRAGLLLGRARQRPRSTSAARSICSRSGANAPDGQLPTSNVQLTKSCDSDLEVGSWRLDV